MKLHKALKETLESLEYSLHTNGQLFISDYDERQKIIDQDSTVVKARKVLKEYEEDNFVFPHDLDKLNKE